MSIVAKQKYGIYTKLIKEQIKQLQASLEHHNNISKGKIHYGHVGDLAHVADTLKNINEFFSPESTDKVAQIREQLKNANG
ncbi:MAG: hypothetical protein UZ05_CHB002001002 [Chlorobi bacterium OLB5]|nr:MAG: hypothetical protein UZ05_CHB002001002 [Chlorobi bacterium OLB5]